jgi:hypothetical protein
MVIAIVSLNANSPFFKRFKGILFNSHDPKLGDCAELMGNSKNRSNT